MRVQIMGAGSLGSLVGGILSEGGLETHLVARESHVDAVNQDGLMVIGDLEFTSKPSASVEPRDSDATLVTVKSYATETAAKALSKVNPGIVASLQNGMGNEDTLSRHLERVLAGTTTYGAYLQEPGVVECTGIGGVDLGAPGGGGSAFASELVKTFNNAGLNTNYREDMPPRLWSKLAVNAGINPVTALTRLKNGDAVVNAEEIIQAAAHEAGRVAEEHGFDLGEVADEAVRVAEETAENESSMLQDVRRCRRTEIDAINGYIVGESDDMGVATPVNQVLYSLIKGLESSYLGVEE